MSDTTTAPERDWYRALDMLTGPCAPKVKGRVPFWRPVTPKAIAEVRLPQWSWEVPQTLRPWDPADTITLDVNAAYLAACSSAVFAHGQLVHDGPADLSAPGAYLIDAHHWNEPGIVSPLGTRPLRSDRVWVMQPTAKLLAGIPDYWPGVTVYDAWTCPVSCRLRKWTEAVQADRIPARRATVAGVPGAAAEYKRIKDGYSAAVEMMAGPAADAKAKAEIRRPDWYATVHAQHAASTWRKAFTAWLTGHGPVRMGAVDELEFLTSDIEAIMQLPRPPFRFDPTGESLGALGVKDDQDDQEQGE